MRAITANKTTTTNNFIDRETGELIDTDSVEKGDVLIVDTQEEFTSLYYLIMGAVRGLDKTSILLLLWSAIKAQYNTNVVTFNKPICDIITEDTGLKYQSIKNAVSRMARMRILIPMGSATYRVNPAYAWRGPKDGRKTMMKYILEVQCPECVPSEILESKATAERRKEMKKLLKKNYEAAAAKLANHGL